MNGKRYTTEDKIRLLREADRGEKSILELCREANVSELTFHRWKKQFGHMEVNEGNAHHGEFGLPLRPAGGQRVEAIQRPCFARVDNGRIPLSCRTDRFAHQAQVASGQLPGAQTSEMGSVEHAR